MGGHIIKAGSPEAAGIRIIGMFADAPAAIRNLERNRPDRILDGVFEVNPAHATKDFTPCFWFSARKK